MVVITGRGAVGAGLGRFVGGQRGSAFSSQSVPFIWIWHIIPVLELSHSLIAAAAHVRHHTIWYHMVPYHMIWYGTIPYHTISQSYHITVTWYDTIPYHMISLSYGMRWFPNLFGPSRVVRKPPDFWKPWPKTAPYVSRATSNTLLAGFPKVLRVTCCT